MEHFRPKHRAEFHLLAYDWANLYFCCDQCQSNKLDQWDELLLAPDHSGYEFNRYFAFDFTTGAILASPSATPDDQRRATLTIQIYDLDTVARRRYRRLEAMKWLDSSQGNLDEWAYRDFLNP